MLFIVLFVFFYLYIGWLELSLRKCSKIHHLLAFFLPVEKRVPGAILWEYGPESYIPRLYKQPLPSTPYNWTTCDREQCIHTCVHNDWSTPHRRSLNHTTNNRKPEKACSEFDWSWATVSFWSLQTVLLRGALSLRLSENYKSDGGIWKRWRKIFFRDDVLYISIIEPQN